MSDKKEDKACPFCGSDEWYFADHQEGCYLYKMHMADEEDADYGKDEMMESWNTRPALAGDKECEWKSKKDYTTIFNSSCGVTSVHSHIGYKFCPYCGLEIKEQS